MNAFYEIWGSLGSKSKLTTYMDSFANKTQHLHQDFIKKSKFYCLAHPGKYRY